MEEAGAQGGGVRGARALAARVDACGVPRGFCMYARGAPDAFPWLINFTMMLVYFSSFDFGTCDSFLLNSIFPFFLCI